MEFICIKRFVTEFINLTFEEGIIYELKCVTQEYNDEPYIFWLHKYYFNDSVVKEHFISVADWRQKQIDSILEN